MVLVRVCVVCKKVYGCYLDRAMNCQNCKESACVVEKLKENEQWFSHGICEECYLKRKKKKGGEQNETK